MTFLYWTSVVTAALVIFYAVGCIIAFCALFFVISEHKKEHIIEDMLYSLGSWLTIVFIALCYALNREEERLEKQYD